MSITANINEKANLIWAIADKLTGVYKPHYEPNARRSLSKTKTKVNMINPLDHYFPWIN